MHERKFIRAYLMPNCQLLVRATMWKFGAFGFVFGFVWGFFFFGGGG